MLGRTILIALSIAYVPGLVDAGPTGRPARQEKGKAHEMTLEGFVKRILKEGDDNKIGPNNARVLGFEGDPPTKGFERTEEESSDNLYRTFDIMVEKHPETGELKPVALVLFINKQAKLASESHWLRLHPDGTISKAIRKHGKNDEEGKPVRGSAINIDLDPDEAKALVQRELDFWLKGKGLKKKPAAESAQKETAKAKAEQPTKAEVPSKTEAPSKPETK